MCRKKQISLPDYKIVTVSHFKMISHNRLKICIVKLSFFSSIKEAYLPGGHIHKRLDRCMTNVDWCILFPHALAELLLSSNSDHNLIMLSCSKSRTKRLKSFYLQAAWSMHCDYGSIVWDTFNKLIYVKEDSTKFNDEVFGNIFCRKHQIEARLRGVHKQLDIKHT